MPEVKSFTIEPTGPISEAGIIREGFILNLYSSEKVSPLVFIQQVFVDAQHLSNLGDLIQKIREKETEMFKDVKSPESNF